MRQIPKKVVEAVKVVLDELCNEVDLSEHEQHMEDPEGAKKLMTAVVLLQNWIADADTSEAAVEKGVAEYWA